MPRPASRAGRLWKAVRPWLYWTHRWLGIASCLLFAMWFASGIVMMYVPFPSLSEAARRAALAPIDWDAVTVSPDHIAGLLGRPPRDLRLRMRGTEPIYHAVSADSGISIISARTGALLPPVSGTDAISLLGPFPEAGQPRLAETLARDQWTVPQSFDVHRPLHLVALGDNAGTWLHVSSRTGEVVLRTTRSERFWNWLGAVPHWLYFTPLRENGRLWANVVLWISGACIPVALTGLWIGLLRARLGRTRYGDGRVSPYRGWMLWHHIAGLAGGLGVVTFIISGWLSLNPGNAFVRQPFPPDALAAFGGANGRAFPGDPAAARHLLPQVVEVQFLWFGGRPLVLAADAASRLRLADPQGRAAVLSDADIVSAAAMLRPGRSLRGVERLTREDVYWYSHHRTRALPVVRVMFDDPEGTWVHVDPASGAIAGSSTSALRLYRWLYNGLHSLDITLLLQHRPAWDLVMLTLCAAGLLISASGTVIGWRRLARVRKRSAAPVR